MARIFSHIGVWVVMMICLGLTYNTQALEREQNSSILPQVSCKAKSFAVFFKNFTESLEVQKKCTYIPLKKSILLEDGGDLTPVLQTLSAKQLSYPLILSTKQKAEQHLYLKIQVNHNKNAKVIYFKPDTGYQVIYRFKAKNNNWKLIQIEDWSV